MSDIVVMPGHSRPEYFKVWTELVQKAHGADELFYLFCLDSGYDKKYDELISEFPYECGIIRMPEQPGLALGKQSRNVLNGLVAAAQHTDELVYYVEEDVFIGVDFFRWHKEIHKREKDIFCSIGTKSNNFRYDVDGFVSHYFLTSECDYQALGSCFKKSVILDLIYPHFNDAYLNNPTAYCLRNFPLSSIGKIWTEQDGLIRRILELKKMKVAFPCLPFAFHSGFYGYNRQPEVMRKTYDEKLALTREVCFDRAKMRAWQEGMGESYWKDSIPCELDNTFQALKRVRAEIIINTT
jgi:hypothetical protein